MGTRNGAQIRSHAQKYFSKATKTLEDESNDSKIIISKLFYSLTKADLVTDNSSRKDSESSRLLSTIEGLNKRESKFILKVGF